jgi:hypothetical protein
MSVTRMRHEMGEWEFTHWLGLTQLRQERAGRAARKRKKG